jgi:hypothetical protein
VKIDEQLCDVIFAKAAIRKWYNSEVKINIPLKL